MTTCAIDNAAAIIVMAVIFALCGLGSLTASLLNVDWFFKSYNVRAFTFGLSRPWQRIIYGVAGLLMLLMAWHLIDSAHIAR